MLEIPEAMTIARQPNETVKGKKIAQVITAESAGMMGFSFFWGDQNEYDGFFKGRVWGEACANAGVIEITTTSSPNPSARLKT